MGCALREWKHAGVKNGSGEDADPPSGSARYRAGCGFEIVILWHDASIFLKRIILLIN